MDNKLWDLWDYSFILCALTILSISFIYPVSAFCSDASIVAYPSSTSIKWDYSSCQNIINASVDGVLIKDFSTSNGVFVLSGLQPNESHRFSMRTVDGLFYNDSQTIEKPLTESDKTFGYFNTYIFLIIALVFLAISAWIQMSAFMSLIFSLAGLTQSALNNDFTMILIFVTMTLVSLASVGYDRK